MQTMPVDYIPEFEDEDTTGTTPQVRTMPVDYEPEFEDDGDFIPGLQRGINQTQAMGYGSAALVGSVLEKAGAESVGGWLKEKGMEGYRRNIQEAEQYPKKYSFKDVYTGKAGFGGTVDYVQGTLAELIPSMVEAAAGAVIGTAVTPGAGTGIGAFGARTILKRSIDKLAKEAVEAQIKKGVVKEGAEAALEQQIKKEVTKRSLKKLGGKAGMGAAVLPMEAGGSYAGLMEEHGVDNPASALFFGALATSLEYFGGNSRLIDTMVDGVAKGNGGLIKRAAKEILTNAPQEAMQEAGQEAFQVLNTVVNTDEKFLTPEHIEEIIEGAGAGLVGGVGGGALQAAMSKDAKQDILGKKDFDTGVPDETPATPEAETADPWESEFDAEWNRRAEQKKQQAMGRPAPDPTDVRIQDMRTENQRQMERMEAPPDYDLKGSVNLLESNVEKLRRLKRQEESVQALQQRQQAMGQPGMYQPPTARAAQTAMQGFEGRQERHLPSDANVPIIEGGQAPFIPVPGVQQEKTGYYPFADLAERLGGREKLLGPEPETPSPIIPGTALRGRPVFEHEVDPAEVNTEPTEAQKSAGNYKKDHIKIDGLDISIENPAWSTRKGKDRTGKEWETQMQSHYGYFKRSTGKDGDQVDVFIKPDTETSPKVFVVDQVDPDTGKFDEHKAILGAENEQEARDIYLSNYEDGWQGLGAVTEMDQASFKKWLKDGTKTKKPVAKVDNNLEKVTDDPDKVDNKSTDKESLSVQNQLVESNEMVQPMKPGQSVTWKTKNGEALTGTLSKKVKTNWFVEKPDGKKTLVPEGQLTAVEGKAKAPTKEAAVVDVFTSNMMLDLKKNAEKEGRIYTNDQLETQEAAFRKAANDLVESVQSKDFQSLEDRLHGGNPESLRLFRVLTGKSTSNQADIKASIRSLDPKGYDAWNKTRKEQAAKKEGEKEAAEAKKAREEMVNRPVNDRYSDETWGQWVNRLIEEGHELTEEKRGFATVLSLSKGNNTYSFKTKQEQEYVQEQYDKLSSEQLRNDMDAEAKDMQENPDKYISKEQADELFGKKPKKEVPEGWKKVPGGGAVSEFGNSRYLISGKPGEYRLTNEENGQVIGGVFTNIETASEKGNQHWIESQRGEKDQTPTKPEYGAKNKLFTQDAAEKARARIRSKLNQLNTGLDPELMQDGITMAGYHIEAGARSFAAYSKAMIQDFGEAIKPYLRSFYEGVRYYPGLDNTGMTDPKDIESGVTETQETEPTPEMVAYNHFKAGKGFKNITDARQIIGEATGQEFKPGSIESKQLDEQIELAAVKLSREIAASGKTEAQIFDDLADLQSRMPNLSVRTSTSIRNQAYSTPLPMAYVGAQLAGVNAKTTVFEPSGGNGALLMTANPSNVHANELEQTRVDALESQGFARVTQADGTKVKPDNAVDVVIANPPFGTVKNESGETQRWQINRQYETTQIDHAMVFNSLKGMKEDGRALFIVGSVKDQNTTKKGRQLLYRNPEKVRFFKTLYDNYNVVDHFSVSGKLYSKQGASWPVDVIVIDGKGKSERPLPGVEPPALLTDITQLKEKLNERTDGLGADKSGRRGDVRRGDLDTTPASGGKPESAVSSGKPDTGSDRTGTGKEQSIKSGGPGKTDGRKGSSTPRSGEDTRSATVRDTDDRGKSDPKRSLESDDDTGSAADSTADQRRTESQTDSGKRQPGKLGGKSDRSVKPKVSDTDSQVSYKPASKSSVIGTLTPVNMSTAMKKALSAMEKKHGSVDQFVADKLGYTVEEITGKDGEFGYFSGEQVDAIALGIENIDSGAGFIIGDQTGVGKGRVVAAMIRYAMSQGITPIFVTEKPNLYADMYRDLSDIGMADMADKILMTNRDQKLSLSEDGSVELVTKSNHNTVLRDAARNQELPDPFRVVFTTYDQMNQATSPRRDLLKSIIPNSMLIMDEAHNAGGTEGAKIQGDKYPRSIFFRELVREAHSVFYSSATYSKRPGTMDLYSKTDMRFAVDDVADLGAAIEAGGVPLQQVVASMLTESGQYVRRERSFDGIDYATKTVKVDRKVSEVAAKSFAEIKRFSDEFIEPAIDDVADDMAGSGGAATGGSAAKDAQVQSTGFSAVMHNLVNQMLLSMKTYGAIDEAIEVFKKQGKKPVITLSNTMGAFIEEYAERFEIKPGEHIGLKFNDLIFEYLDKTRRYTTGAPFSKNRVKHYLSDEDLGPAGVAEFNKIRDMIYSLELGDLPVSPVDYIKAKLEEAGLRVAEITGRGHTIEYRADGTQRYARRGSEEKSIKARTATIYNFNTDKLDALIINRSGSTGLSLHSLPKFEGHQPPPRHMIILQAEGNIDTHMQMLGRINRAGQINTPSYSQLVGDTPAEMRPAAVLAAKMASLNANTTADTDSAVTAKGVTNFINKYGDEVAARIMTEYPEWHKALGNPLPDSSTGLDKQDAARKVTGKMPMLPLADQEQLYAMIEDEYNTLIDQLNATGENDLEARTFDTDARVLKTAEVAKKTGPSPFQGSADAQLVDMKKLGKSYTGEQVKQALEEKVHGEKKDVPIRETVAKGKTDASEKVMAAMAEFDEYVADRVDDIEDPQRRNALETKLNGNKVDFSNIARELYPGRTASLVIGEEEYFSTVIDVKQTGSPKNPLAMGTWKATFAIADSMRRITYSFLNLSKPDVMYPIGVFSEGALSRYDNASQDAREERTIITGNMLAAYGMFQTGRIINFTDQKGEVQQGILMPRKFDLDKANQERPVVLNDVDSAMKVMEAGRLLKTRDELVITKVPGQERWAVNVPASRAKGSKYYLNGPILNILGSEFVKSGNRMRAFVEDRQSLRKLASYLINDMAETLRNTHEADSVRALLGIETQSMADVSGGKFQTSTDYTPGQGLNLKDIRKRFPGQAVFLSPDGSVAVRMENGMGLTIRQVRDFGNGDIRLAMQAGRMDKSGVVLGKYQSKEITLNRDLADTITRDHELYHFLAENLLTKGDRLAIKAKASAYHKAGKFRFKWRPQMEENEANAFAQFLNEREQHRGTPLGRAIQAIVDFFDGLVHIGRASARKLAREMESGKVFGRQPAAAGQGAGQPQFMFAGLNKGDSVTISVPLGAGKVQPGATGTIASKWGKTGYMVKFPGVDGTFIVDKSEVSLHGQKQRFKRIPVKENKAAVSEYLKNKAFEKIQTEQATAGDTLYRVVWDSDQRMETNPAGLTGLPQSDNVSAIHVSPTRAEAENWGKLLAMDYDRGDNWKVVEVKTMDGDYLAEDVQQVAPSEMFGRTLDSRILITGRPELNRMKSGAYYQTSEDRINEKFHTDPTTRERVSEVFSKAKSQEERSLAMDRFVSNTLDNLHFVKQRLGDEAYKMHRMLTGINSSTFTTWLKHGRLFVNGNTFGVKGQDQGPMAFFKTLGSRDAENLVQWVAAKRAELLDPEGREKHLDEDTREAIFEKVGTHASDGRSWAELNLTLQKFNKNILDVAQEAGLIDPVARAEWESNFYIPFNRIMEDPETYESFLSGPRRNRQHISAQIRRLKGGEGKIDPMGNLFRNWMFLLDASARNMARANAFDVGSKIGIIKEVPRKELINIIGSKSVTRYAVRKTTATKAAKVFDTEAEAKAWIEGKPGYQIEQRKYNSVTFGRMRDFGILSFQRNGEPVYFKTLDQDLFEALSEVDTTAFNNVFMKMMGGAKRWLSYGVTFGPAFRLRNMLRDTVHVAIVSKSFAPFMDSARGFVKAMKEDEDFKEYSATGFAFGSSYIHTDDPTHASRMIKKLIKQEGDGVVDNILHTPKKLLRIWEKIGEASENAARLGLYTNLRKQGKTAFEAGFEARDLMDFSMRGGAQTVQILTRIIPFLNARGQGLYKLSRSAHENPKAFVMKAAMYTTAALALWSLFKDDDRYKELQDWDKWTYHHFWLGDDHYRIPKPFEIGALFASLPESVANVMNGTEDGKFVWDWFQFTAHDVFNVDMPQLFKPVVEERFNMSTFRGQRIVPDYMTKLKPSEQYKEYTSESMRAIGKQLNISPIKLEHYVNGYFSTLGMMVLSASDSVVRAAGGYPARPTGGPNPFTLGVVNKKYSSNKYVNRFYDFYDEVDTAYRTFRHLAKTGQADEAKAFARDNAELLSGSLRKTTNKIRGYLSDINQKIKMVQRDKTMTPKEKREIIDLLNDRKKQVTKALFEQVRAK